MESRKLPTRKDSRVIIHFVRGPFHHHRYFDPDVIQDYDCFYASVFEAKNPALKSLPFAVQQKQIIVTCNYEARRRGLHKLQLIRDARRICPDVVIELGEDISRFRDASKELYQFIKNFSWNGKVERLGFDEVWMDVTDLVEANLETLNRYCLESSFFQLSKEDPTQGFAFDASMIAGHPYPADYTAASTAEEEFALTLRLRLGSQLALHIRHALEQQKGYTCTVGISTSKLLSKLVGNLNKPKGQTTILPPLSGEQSNVNVFLDAHEIGKIPGIGFKLAQKLRAFFLRRPASFDNGLVYGETKESVTVADLRKNADVNPEMLEKLLTGPGSPHGIGGRIWGLLHGVDDSEVGMARAVPRQISIEDSYIRLDTMVEARRELTSLAVSLLTRMRVDLLGGMEDEMVENEDVEGDDPANVEIATSPAAGKTWLAHPKTLRLTTRPRAPLQADGTRLRSFKRISHSAPLPNCVFSLHDSVPALAERLVKESLIPMFHRLHPEKAGWNLSLVNLAVTNMVELAGESRTAIGRNIGTMFRMQDDVLRDFRVREKSLPADDVNGHDGQGSDVEIGDVGDLEGEDGGWDDGDGDGEMDEVCQYCGMAMPGFAMLAHRRFHELDPG